jgi:hypothetical protein
MPIQGGPSNHPTPAAAQLPIVTRTITFTDAGFDNSVDLFCENLPGLSAWFLITAISGGAAVSIQLQFAFGQGVGGVVWRPLVPAYAIAVGTPSLVNFRLGSRRYRAVTTLAGAPGSTATVLYRLAAALT